MSEGTQAFLVLIVLVALALLIPPRWDPAMRLKQWAERRNDRP